MKIVALSVFGLLFLWPLGAQPNEPLLANRLYADGHSYPDFLFGEKHAWLLIGYSITGSTAVEIQAFYDKYVMEERLRVPLTVKQYFGSKWYVFSGVEYDFLLTSMENLDAIQQNITKPQIKPRLDYLGGVGYDVQEDFMLDVKVNQQINDSKLHYFGQKTNTGRNSLLTIGGRYKF